MKKGIISILGLFISLNVWSQNDSLINELELKLLNKQYDSVISSAERILEKDSVNWQVYYYLGKSFQAKYKIFDAIKNFEKAYKLDSTNRIIENALADAYDFIGKDEQAIQLYYDQYLRDTLNIEPIVNLANIFRKKKEYGSAIHYYQKANLIDPTNFYYLKQLAFCYDKINIVDGAAMSYKIALGFNPYDISMYIQLANILNSQHDFKGAITVCNNGLSVQKDNVQLLKLRSYSYYLNKDLDSAIVGFNQLLQMSDSSYFNLKYQGLAYFDKKEFEKAKNSLNLAMEYNDQDPETYFYYGSALGRSGENKEGLLNLNKSMSLLEPSPKEVSNIFSEMAYIYQEDGKYEVAVEYLKSAYKYNADPILSFKMAQLYDVLGNKKLAIDYYDGFLIMYNPPESNEFQLEVDVPVIKDQAMIDHAENRIRILKEEMFFEEGNKK